MKELKIKTGRILVLAPHPDDESIGCGGLLLKHRGQCDVVVLTDGRHGGLLGQEINDVVASRKLEFEKAMTYAGVNKWTFLGIEDGELSKNFYSFSKLDIGSYDIIFIPSSSEVNVDHACVTNFVARLKFRAKIFEYEISSTLNCPSHYIDISDVVDEKKRLISFYKTQTAQVDYVSKSIGLNCFRGLLPYPAVSYAEAYKEYII